MSDERPPDQPTTMQRVQPPVTPLTEPFWEATREGRYLLQWCLDCGEPIFYPREICPRCLDSNLEWREASGDATVYAVTVEHRPQDKRNTELAPYVVALVDLAEGVRVLSNVIGCPPDDVSVGMAVRLTWEPLEDGRRLPQFEPADQPAQDPPTSKDDNP